jgi:hypothetical protein
MWFKMNSGSLCFFAIKMASLLPFHFRAWGTCFYGVNNTGMAENITQT